MPKAYLQFNIGIADLLHVEALPWERFIGPLVFFYTSICRSRRLLGCWHLGMICAPITLPVTLPRLGLYAYVPDSKP